MMGSRKSRRTRWKRDRGFRPLLAAYLAGALCMAWSGEFSSLHGAALVPLVDDRGAIHDLQIIGTEVWMGTDKGLVRLVSQGTRRDDLEDSKVYSILETGGPLGVLLGTSKGLVSLLDEKFEAFEDERLTPSSPADRVRLVMSNDGSIYIGTGRGLSWIPSGETQVRSIFENEAVLALSRIGSNVLAGTAQNAYTIAVDNAESLFEEPGSFAELIDVGEGIAWICETDAQDRPKSSMCWNITPSGPKPIPATVGIRPLTARRVQGRVLIGSLQGVFVASGDYAIKLVGFSWAVHMIKEIDGILWIGSTKTLSRKDVRHGVSSIAVERFETGRDLRAAADDGASVWFWGNGGAYLYDPTIEGRVVLERIRLFGIDVLVGREAKATEVAYARNGRPLVGVALPTAREAILSADRQRFQERLRKNDFRRVDEESLGVSAGRQRIFSAVMDSAGNVLFGEALVWVLPTPYVMTVLGVALYYSIVLFAFVWAVICASRSNNATALLTSDLWPKPHEGGILARIISGLLIPALLLLPLVHRRMLSRFRFVMRKRMLAESPTVLSAFAPVKIKKLQNWILSRESVWIAGDPAIAERMVAEALVRPATKTLRSENAWTPLLLKLDVWSRNVDQLMAGCVSALRSAGAIRNDALARRLLIDTGGLVLLLSGFDQLSSPDEKNAVKQLAELCGAKNVVVYLSSIAAESVSDPPDFDHEIELAGTAP